MATRFLSRARGDPQKGVNLMKATQEWRQEYFRNGPVTDDSVYEDMKHGIAYFCGRDSALRPLLIVRPTRIPNQWYKERRTDKLINLVIFCMEYFLRYMVVPGKVENLSLVIDLKGLGISQVPISVLGEINSVCSHHYIGRVFRSYIVNMSWTLSTIASMARKLLTDRQNQKIMMLDKLSDLYGEIAYYQLEEDLGGKRAKIETFLPFPIAPGPYEAGSMGTPLTNSHRGAHGVLTALGAQGRLWNPNLCQKDNVRLLYTAQAADILQRCGLPVPEELRPKEEPAPAPAPQAEGVFVPTARPPVVEVFCLACDDLGCSLCRHKKKVPVCPTVSDVAQVPVCPTVSDVAQDGAQRLASVNSAASLDSTRAGTSYGDASSVFATSPVTEEVSCSTRLARNVGAEISVANGKRENTAEEEILGLDPMMSEAGFGKKEWGADLGPGKGPQMQEIDMAEPVITNGGSWWSCRPCWCTAGQG